MKERRRGLALASCAAVLKSGFLVPYKAALEAASYSHVLVSMLFFAALFNSFAVAAEYLHALRRGSLPTAPRDERLGLTLLVIVSLSLLAIAGNATLGKAVEDVDTAVAAVLAETQVFFVVLMGLIVLGERVRTRFVLGASVAVAGIAVMSGAFSSERVGLAGVLWGLLSAACFGGMQVITRKYIQRIRPMVVNAGRLWLAVGLLAAIPGYARGAWSLPWSVTTLTATAAFAGPLLGRTCLIYSARYIPAALTTLVGVSTPVFVLLLAAATLDEWPSGLQVLGGTIVLAGMGVALSERARDA